MKKLYLLLLVFVSVGVGGQQEYFQHLDKWNNIERDIHRMAIAFVNERKTNPNIVFQLGTEQKSGLLYQFNYFPELDRYSIRLYLSTPELSSYNIPFIEQLSIKMGASFKFETLYGEPELDVESGDLMRIWDCSSWYRSAAISQTVEGYEIIGLAFYEDDL